MKTKDECKSIVARKHGLGKTLVTGHRAAYWEEAMDLFANQYKEQNKEAEQPVKFPECHHPKDKIWQDNHKWHCGQCHYEEDGKYADSKYAK